MAAEVISIIAAARPDLRVEHIGSTSVPGLPGKGIVDLGTEADAAEIPAVTAAMRDLGFGPQPGPNPWPPTRPMHVGSVIHDGDEFRIHFHVHPRGTGDLAKDLRFRDALRADPALVEGYARIKRGIVEKAGGPLDGVIYQAEKGGWILEVYDRLGIERPANAGGGGPTGEAEPTAPEFDRQGRVKVVDAGMSAHIRSAGTDDVMELARLRWDMQTEEEPSAESYATFVVRFRPFAEAALRSTSWRVWVAEADASLVGNLWLQLVPRVPRPGAGSSPLGYLTNVFVAQAHRNSGLGSRLLDHVVDWSRKHPTSVVVVWPSDEAIQWYRRAGFAPSEALQRSFHDD